eukprot:TRINITY_DN72031_c0_g1_i1.p1 TRINITY_DN72031_c0_g1~~TRINITY_DN72031_c0_g1_i1.p1  ORF type:complete len:552 (+),score=94.13 TRINITY_DN72031_c0_g1_i1:122-1777(+)
MLQRIKRQPWLLGLIIPAFTLLLLLMTDSFNLRGSLFGSYSYASSEISPVAALPEVPTQAPQPAAPLGVMRSTPSPPRPRPRQSPSPVEKPRPRPAPKPQPRPRPWEPDFECKPEEFPKFAAASKEIRSTGVKESKQKTGLASLLGLKLASERPQGGIPPAIAHLASSKLQRRIGASIAVHPPKYYALAMFLHDWMSCPAAFEAMNIYVVFQFQKDLNLFREAMSCISPGFPELWTPVIARTPKRGWYQNVGLGNQYTAAYKKYYGIAAMMDIGNEEYGLMLDSEISVYDFHARAKTGNACGPRGAWSELFDRIRTMELNKVWPASRVSATLATYNFGSFQKSGRDYDQHLLRENGNFINGYKAMTPKYCTYDACKKVFKQIDNVLWSWWTDLPWLNLTVAKKMFAHLADKKEKVKDVKSWRETAVGITFPRFEYVAYQMWTVLHEGWDYLDVTDITLEAKWGSYLEDPQFGSRLAELKPMWTSAEALWRVEDDKIPGFSEIHPPLLIFHVDHENLRYSFGEHAYKQLWETLVLDLLKRDKRKDYDGASIK